MANNLGVSVEKLKETVNTLRNQKSIMAGKLSDISNAVAQLNSSWQSDAANNLKPIADKMAEKFTGLEKEVEGFAVFLERVIEGYIVTEHHTTNLTDEVMNQYS